MKSVKHKKEGVFVSNESTIATESTTETGAMTAAAENRGVSEENKIVPIVQTASVSPAAEPVLDSAVSAPVPGASGAADESVAGNPAPAQTETASAEPPKEKPKPERIPETRSRSYQEDFDSFDFDDEERPKRSFFRFRSNDDEETRDKLILSRIKDEDLMEYLALEQRRLEFLQQSKELKEKRILTAFQLLISLAAIVAITYLLKDNPTILISILYIVGIIAALNIWKNPHKKDRDYRRR